jgi:hypothetical protein
MAISAIDSDLSDVVFVAEGDRLHPHNMGSGQIRRSNDLANRDCHRGNNEDCAEDGESREEVDSSAENLSHRSPVVLACHFPRPWWKSKAT